MHIIDEIAQKESVRTYSLMELGIHDVAFSRNDTIKIINRLEKELLPILGGDVFLIEQGHVNGPISNSWYCEREYDESWYTFVRRSCEMAIHAVLNEKAKNALFEIVVSDCPDDL